jgi:hypothetical protein
VAAVLTPVQPKQIRIYINKTIQKHSTNNTKQNTAITSTHITKTPTKSSDVPLGL